MMKLVAIALASLIVLVAVPASASHMGPCTHEYVDPLAAGLANIKSPDVKGALGGTVANTVWCVTHPCPGCLYLP